jgi:hypothetical protein
MDIHKRSSLPLTLSRLFLQFMAALTVYVEITANNCFK